MPAVAELGSLGVCPRALFHGPILHRWSLALICQLFNPLVRHSSLHTPVAILSFPVGTAALTRRITVLIFGAQCFVSAVLRGIISALRTMRRWRRIHSTRSARASMASGRFWIH